MTGKTLKQEIEEALHKTPARTVRLETNEGGFWLKRTEQHRGLRRFQKGDPAQAFDREREGYHRIMSTRLPVPPIVAEGPDWFVVPDCGHAIAQILLFSEGTQNERNAAFEAAGRGLALWHAVGLSHGRPSIRDICWSDGKIAFIDLENFRDRLNGAYGHARDLLIFIHSGFALGRGPNIEMDHAIESYRDADQRGVWDAAKRLSRWLRPVDFLTKPIQNRPDDKSREIKAIPHTLKVFDED